MGRGREDTRPVMKKVQRENFWMRLAILGLMGTLATFLAISSSGAVFAVSSEKASCLGTGSSTDGPLGLRDDDQRQASSLPGPVGQYLSSIAQLHEGSYEVCFGQP